MRWSSGWDRCVRLGVACTTAGVLSCAGELYEPAPHATDVTHGAPAPGSQLPAGSGSALPKSGVMGSGALDAEPAPETVWLAQVGVGADQNRKLCMRGGTDPIASALCAMPTPTIKGLTDLHKVLKVPESAAPQNTDTLQGPGPFRLLALNADSASLLARTVSAINPRLLIGVVPALGAQHDTATAQFAIGFTRGESFVELAGYEPDEGKVAFYLLVFQPSCAQERCSAAELLSESVESNWRGWTLYEDEDLRNTPFDCLSCHEPDGEAGARHFLMRQLVEPWMHFMPQEPSSVNCSDANLSGSVPYVQPTLFSTFQRVHAGETRYGGVALSDLAQVRAGRQLQSFIENFQSSMPGNLANMAAPIPSLAQSVGETHVFPSRAILAEALCQASQTRWTAYAADLRTQGRFAPFYMPDVLDPLMRDSVVQDYAGFLRTQQNTDPFEVLSRLMSEQAAQAIGSIPADPSAAPETLLTEMCVRCHSNATDPQLSRSRFNAESLAGLTPKEAGEALRRISLPPRSPQAMPPRRAGQLPEWAIARLRDYFTARSATLAERP